MDTGATGPSTRRAAINVTPLIDVLLVLLIIFMVIEPVAERGLAATVPQPERHGAKSPDQPVMLAVRQADEGVRYTVNGKSIAVQDLSASLQSIFKAQAEKTVFIDGDARLEFSVIAAVVDTAQASGAASIAFVTPRMLAGH